MWGRLTLQRRDSQTAVQDDLTNEYYAFSNKLKNVDGTEDENYTYDEIGNLIADEEEGIAEIQWTPYGKVRKVVKDDNSEIQFRYDASGNRIAKITATDTTVYARDASGNVMAVYKGMELEEQSIYGSSRLGLVNYASKTGYRSLGGKKYELSNHLGNVLAVVSDNIHLNQDSTWTSLINTTDYYPFGLAMDGRSEQDSTYRYGFQGQEKDDEIKGEGKSINYKYRMHDPRIGRFFAVDPLNKKYPYWSPYAFSGNRVIDSREQEGLQPERVTETAGSFQGTPYEFGGKKPAFKNGLPDGMTHDYYMQNIGYPSSGIRDKGGYGSRYNNPNYSNEVNLNRFLLDGATSCGIDCSGLSGTSFNSDQQKLMDDFDLNNQNARMQKTSFTLAENDDIGFLGNDFNKISEGDLIFNATATHVMVATGQSRDQNGRTQIEVIHAPETGRNVETEWRTVGSGWTYGHTFRNTDNVLPAVEIRDQRIETAINP